MTVCCCSLLLLSAIVPKYGLYIVASSLIGAGASTGICVEVRGGPWGLAHAYQFYLRQDLFAAAGPSWPGSI